jgi:phosphotransferase system HPr-like phosphotransfer protein
MLGVLSLGATCGTIVTLETDDDGPQGEQTIALLADLLGRDLDSDSLAGDV